MKSIIKSALVLTLIVPGVVSASDKAKAAWKAINATRTRQAAAVATVVTPVAVGVAGYNRADQSESFMSWLGRGCGLMGQSPAQIKAEKARKAAEAKAKADAEARNATYFARGKAAVVKAANKVANVARNAGNRVKGYAVAYKKNMVERPVRTAAATLAVAGLGYGAYRAYKAYTTQSTSALTTTTTPAAQPAPQPTTPVVNVPARKTPAAKKTTRHSARRHSRRASVKTTRRNRR